MYSLSIDDICSNLFNSSNNRIILILSIDDYDPRNLEVAALIKKYGFEKQTIFFIECISAEAQEQIKKLFDMGFQIGSHTLTHCILTRTALGQAKWEIEFSKKLLEKLLDKKVEWFAYPRGYYNKDIMEMVKNAGYKYARTTLLRDCDSNFEKGGIHLSYPRKEYEGKNPFQVAKESEIEHYWFHVKELAYQYSFEELEKFLIYLKEGN